MKKPKKVIGWFLIIASGIFLLFAAFSSDNEKAESHNQTAITTGSNSSTVNLSATASGSNSTLIQAAPGSTVNTTVNPGRATNPALVPIAIGPNAAAGNVIQTVGENNSGNVAQLNNSPNSKVNQSIVNQYSGQEFLGTSVDSTNVPVPIDPSGIYAGYKTQFSAYVKGQVGKVKFLMNKFPPGVMGFRQYYAGHQTIDANTEPAPYTVTYYKIVVITSSKIDPSDFGFSVTNIP